MSEQACEQSGKVLLAGQVLGAYRIVRLLGKGGFGAVYEAVQEPLGRTAALKVLRPEVARDRDALRRFKNEAKVLARLDHPSVVQILDFGVAPDGIAFLAMEYLRGQTLGARLAAHRKQCEHLPLPMLLQIAQQTAAVLVHAHAQNIVHRDAYTFSILCFDVRYIATQRRRYSQCRESVATAHWHHDSIPLLAVRLRIFAWSVGRIVRVRISRLSATTDIRRSFSIGLG